MPAIPEPRPVGALRMFTSGQWVASLGGRTFETHNPANGQLIATLPEGTREDADRAVSAARNAEMKASGGSGGGTR